MDSNIEKPGIYTPMDRIPPMERTKRQTKVTALFLDKMHHNRSISMTHNNVFLDTNMA